MDAEAIALLKSIDASLKALVGRAVAPAAKPAETGASNVCAGRSIR